MNKSLEKVIHWVFLSHFKLKWTPFLPEAFLGIKAKEIQISFSLTVLTMKLL